MKRQLVLRVERGMLFPNETDQTIESYLDGVSRSIVLLSVSTFTAFDKKHPFVRDNFSVLSFWFNAENNLFANSIYQKINAIEQKGLEPVILNVHTSLKLLERGFNLPEEQTDSNSEVEKKMFKAYVLLNEIDNNKDDEIFDSLKEQPKEIKFPLSVLSSMFKKIIKNIFILPSLFL